MKLENFLQKIDFYNLTEAEKAKYLAFFHVKTEDIKEFDRAHIESWFDQVGLAPNSSRLWQKIKSAPWSKTSKSGLISLHGKHLKQLEQDCSDLIQSDTISDCSGAILPRDIYNDVKRKYIKHIADQVNWAFESGAYDACAVMMRRLLEILLIHTYRNKGIDDKIKKPDGHFLELEVIINKATTEKALGLTQGVIKELKQCKDLGNYGAHDIIYTCKKTDIEPIILVYRKVISHLIDYAGYS